MPSPMDKRTKRFKDKLLRREFVEAFKAGNDLTAMVLFDNYPRLQSSFLKIMDSIHKRRISS